MVVRLRRAQFRTDLDYRAVVRLQVRRWAVFLRLRRGWGNFGFDWPILEGHAGANSHDIFRE